MGRIFPNQARSVNRKTRLELGKSRRALVFLSRRNAMLESGVGIATLACGRREIAMFSTWTLVAVAVVGIAALGGGLWWALADFVLDRLGSPAADWQSRPDEDGDILSGGAAPAR